MPARYSLIQPDRALLLALRTVIVVILKENPALIYRLAEIATKEHVKPPGSDIAQMAADPAARDQLRLLLAEARRLP
jgi:hypothetical protein